MSTERVPPDLVVRDLKTTSDKIRALAKAGYKRAEISRLLDIRYQHVLNALVGSGISGGLLRQRTAPKASNPLNASSPPNINPELLVQAGFWWIGEWTLNDDEAIALEDTAPLIPGVYAFVLDNAVVYVGLTLRGLRGRMDQYRRGNPRQKTSARVNGLVKGSLAVGKRVRVLAATPEPSEWKGLPVNLAAGLEVGLIQAIRPEWNIQIGVAKFSS